MYSDDFLNWEDELPFNCPSLWLKENVNFCLINNIKFMIQFLNKLCLNTIPYFHWYQVPNRQSNMLIPLPFFYNLPYYYSLQLEVMILR